MKSLKIFLTITLIAALSIAFIACSPDENDGSAAGGADTVTFDDADTNGTNGETEATAETTGKNLIKQEDANTEGGWGALIRP